jgi:uncharacterized membrane protein YgcG
MTDMLKKLKVFLLSLLLFSFTIFPSYADEFNSLDIDVKIDKNGVASLEEKRNTVDEEGTEKYKPIENLGQIQIRDFSVFEEGVNYQEDNPRDVDRSFDQKAYKYGINETDDGVELCWGISKYGPHNYVIKYKVDPIIVGLNDYDLLYRQFINSDMSTPPENVTIKVSGFEPFDDEVKMWGFGMEGDIHNVDGSILMKSTGDVAYGTMMLRFPKGYFDTSFKQNKTFREYADMAIAGSDREENQGEVDDSSYSDDSSKIFAIFIGIFILISIVIIAVFAAIAKSFSSSPSEFLSRLGKDKNFPKTKSLKDQYFGEVPYEGNVENLYLFTKKAYPDTNPSDLLNAFILKWIYEGHVEVKEDKKTLLGKDKSYLNIISKPENMGKLEEDFYGKVMKSLEYSFDGYLDEKSFNKYARKHPETLQSFLDSFEMESSLAMEKEDFIVARAVKKLFGYKTYLDPSQKGIELYSNLIKFKNYLEDYSLIKERELNEVKIWDYFMIYAALFGISEKVFKNLKKTYPEYEGMSLYNYRTIMWANHYSNNMTSQASYNNFISSGGGGSTSFGGGGGSFGGGSGGGSR